MNTEQMINFAREQLEIFAKNSQMGVFLQCVIDTLESGLETEEFKVGDIVKHVEEDIKGIILDDCDILCHWNILDENGCVDEWREKDMKIIGRTNSVKHMIEEMR